MTEYGTLSVSTDVMSPRILSLSVIAFLAGVSIPVAFALNERPQWLDEEFRRCMLEVVRYDHDRRIDFQREYHDELVRDMEQHRSEILNAWNIADEDSRRDAIRDADRNFRDQSRQSKRDFDQRIRELRREVRDRQRVCDRRLDEHEDFVDDLCFASNDCPRNRVCSTERGDCRPACPPDVQTCVQVCAGVCERSTSSRSSRSSNSRSLTTCFDCAAGQNCPPCVPGSSNGNRPWEQYQTNGQVCRDSNDCPASYFCSTNLGECNMSCGTNGNCPCEGTCRVLPTPGNSSSSSRSSVQGGINCQPYVCPDGREFPACDVNGNPVNYFQNPCYT